MNRPSNYPPGVSGNEPEIAGYPEDEDGNPITEPQDEYVYEGEDTEPCCYGFVTSGGRDHEYDCYNKDK